MIEQCNYSHLTTNNVRFQSRRGSRLRCIHAALSSNNGGDLAMATTAASAAKKKGTLGSRSSAERDTYQSKLDLASALSYLGQANYKKAVQCFLKLGLAKDLGGWVGRVCLSDWVMIIL